MFRKYHFYQHQMSIQESARVPKGTRKERFGQELYPLSGKTGVPFSSAVEG